MVHQVGRIKISKGCDVRVIKSRKLRWAVHVVRMEGRSAFKILTGTPTGKTSLGRHRHKWEDNIRVVLKEKGINTRTWVDSAQNRNYWKPSRFHKPWS